MGRLACVAAMLTIRFRLARLTVPRSHASGGRLLQAEKALPRACFYFSLDMLCKHVPGIYVRHNVPSEKLATGKLGRHSAQAAGRLGRRSWAGRRLPVIGSLPISMRPRAASICMAMRMVR